ncbi:MAG: PilT/PilU family type 4a pilus ATPase [Candidatus Omnitrophica bacterium]|nr:PilT/PilU family type 4a pilus ATPase [Candidatus Omnitrophota bacterium]
MRLVALMEMDDLFRAMVEQGGSDLFLKVGGAPFLRVHGRLQPLGSSRLERADVLALAYELLGPERAQLFQSQRDANFAFERAAIGRFRANVLWQRGELALVIRRIAAHIPSLEELGLPARTLRRLADERRGLVLVCGPTGSGKSTTAAALLDHINETRAAHLLTLEDPIEYLFTDRQSIVNQREIGTDTRSFTEGLKQALRQNPDVLFISDIRDRETMEAALLAAESGQLVLSCIHATNAVTTIERIVALFPPHQQPMMRFRLSLVLSGVISLRLLPRRDGAGQSPACEVMIATPTIRQLIQEGRPSQISPLIDDGSLHGMQTLAQALYQLIQRGLVSTEDALAAADSREELGLALQHIRPIRDASHPALRA